jgi:hypothetical protein
MRDFHDALKDRPDLAAIFPNPYDACFHWLVMSFAELAGRSQKEPKFALVHETNHMKKDAIEAFDWIKKTNRDGGCLLSLTFAGKKEFVPLQAADILAFEAARRVKNLSGKPRRSWTALNPPNAQTICKFYNKGNLASLVGNLEEISGLLGDLKKTEEFWQRRIQMSVPSRRHQRPSQQQ